MGWLSFSSVTQSKTQKQTWLLKALKVSFFFPPKACLERTCIFAGHRFIFLPEIMSKDGIAGCGIWSQFISWGAVVSRPDDSLASVMHKKAAPLKCCRGLDVKDGQGFWDIILTGTLPKLQWFCQDSRRSPSASLSSTALN